MLSLFVLNFPLFSNVSTILAKRYAELFPKEKKEKKKEEKKPQQPKKETKKKPEPKDEEEEDDTPKPEKFVDPYASLPKRSLKHFVQNKGVCSVHSYRVTLIFPGLSVFSLITLSNSYVLQCIVFCLINKDGSLRCHCIF